MTPEIEKKVLKINHLLLADQSFSGPLTESDLSEMQCTLKSQPGNTHLPDTVTTKLKLENDTKLTIMNFRVNTPNLQDMTQINTVLNATNKLFFSNYYMKNGKIHLPKNIELFPDKPQLIDINFHVLSNIPFEINTIHPSLDVSPVIDLSLIHI